MSRHNHHQPPREEFRFVAGKAHEVEHVVALNHKCPRCGHKIPYYTKAAAEARLRQLAVRRLIDYGEIAERAIYICHPKFKIDGHYVYHLTSEIEEPDGSHHKNESVLAKRWGVDGKAVGEV